MNTLTSIRSLMVVALCSLPVVAQPSQAAGNAENGRKIYVSVGCFQCHGYEGQGGSSAPVGSYGPRLAPPKLPVAAIRAYVRNPTGGMPPYSTRVLSDGQIDDIYSFLKTRPAARPVKDIPLLN